MIGPRASIGQALVCLAALTASCASASPGAIRPAGATGWTQQRMIGSGRLSQVADTIDAGSRAACRTLRDPIAALAGAGIERCEAVTLSLVDRGRRTTLYDLFVLTGPHPDDGTAAIPLWDPFATTTTANPTASSCGRYEIFVYRRGRQEIRVLGDPIEERTC